MGNIVDILKGLEKEGQNMISDKLGNIAGESISALNGVATLINSANMMSKINDTSKYQQEIDKLGGVGIGSYGSFGDLSSEYGRLLAPKIDVDEIRGLTDGQALGSTLATTAQGAVAGAAFGGVGAAVGGVLGLGAGVYGWLAGKDAAESEKRRLKSQAEISTSNAITNLNAATERLRAINDRQSRAGMRADGGQIRRKTNFQEFADTVLSRKHRNTYNSVGFTSKQQEDGLMVRIKI